MAATYEDFGIYGISTRGKIEQRVICPKCSHTRKKENQNVTCLCVNIEKGTWLCQHCGWAGGLYMRDNNKPFVPKPIKTNAESPTENAYQWFEKRMIPKEVVDRNKITIEKVFMSQLDKEDTCICFNYFVGETLVNIKYRSPRKFFQQVKGGQKIFYKINDLEGETDAIVTEGECFTDDAEILTRNGFILFSEYEGQEVLQVDNDLKGEFVKPIAFIKNCVQDIETMETCSRSHYFRTTMNHNIVVKKVKSNRQDNKSTSSLVKVSAKDFLNYGGQHIIPTTLFKIKNQGINLKDNEIRLAIAISADFTIRKSGDLYCRLKKERKIRRIEHLLNSLGIPYKKRDYDDGYSSIYISRKYKPDYTFKVFPKHWIGEINNEQLQLFIDEIEFWDGNGVINREQIEYSSIIYENVKFVQTIAHMAGFTSTIMRRQNGIGKWYKCSILFCKQTFVSAVKDRSIKNYTGYTYCVQVPSGMILIRQKEKIFISGNCDALAFEVAGFKNAVSVPDGGINPEVKNIHTKLDYLDNCSEYFKDKHRIYLATDMDGPGIRLREELARRLGKSRCWIVRFPEGCKDANEVLMKHGKEKLKECIDQAELYPIEGIHYANERCDELLDLYENGFPNGAKTGYNNFDEHITFYGSQLTIVTGIPSHGKALDILTEIPTPDGMKLLQDIQIGDKVYSDNGEECNVTNVTEIMYDRKCYKIKFSDNNEVIADAEHLWITSDLKSRRSEQNTKQKRGERSTTLPHGTNQIYKRTFPSAKTTEEISKTIYGEHDKRYNHFIKVANPIKGKYKELLIKPYLLGVWLGDGTSLNGSITKPDDEIMVRIAKLGYQVKKWKSLCTFGIKDLKVQLKQLNLLGNKHIPADYLRADYYQRLELLRGLMDSDGCCLNDGGCEFYNTNKTLAIDTFELVASLGLRPTFRTKSAYLNGKYCSESYTIRFSSNKFVFSLQRKMVKQKINSNKISYRSIVSVEPTPSVPVKCIEVDSPSHQYLITKAFIPTHNSNFMDQIMLKLAENHNWSWGIFSPENATIEIHLLRLCEIMVGKPFMKEYNGRMSLDEMIQARDFINEHVYFILPDNEEYKLERILEAASGLVLKHGIKGLIIDPWNTLEHQIGNETETIYTGKVLNQLKYFARIHDIHLILVAHPRKMPKRKDNDHFEVPTLYDISGSANWFNIADNGLVVYRKFSSDFTKSNPIVYIQKVKHKFIGKTGYAKFDFDVTCQRYIERDGGDDDFMKTNKIPEKDYPLSWQQEWEKQKEDDEDPF